ncbi:MAG: hypothetical protein PHT76_11915 [Anaerostipes sp.]|nr:hypothetical protein [Anaerostipes sp.]
MNNIAVFIVGFLLMLGSAGGLERETLDFKTTILLMIIGILLMFIGQQKREDNHKRPSSQFHK